jgi:glycosyltransferase involved in cell wall biosynthesis
MCRSAIRGRRPLHLAWSAFSRPAIDRVIGPIDLLHLTLPTFPIRSIAPQVVTIHDLLPYHHPEWYEWFPLRNFRRSVELHVKVAAAIITPSQVVAEDLVATLKVDPARITVVPEGVDGSFSAPVDPDAAEATCRRLGIPARPFVVTVGAVTARKNLEVVFRALAALDRRGAAPLFVVVGGDGLEAQSIKAAMASIGVSHLVRFVGRLVDEDLHQVLSRAVALVHPSRYEGFGLTPLEAMAAGLPVIASRAGSLPEVLGAAAVLADPDDDVAWANAIEAVSTDADLVARLRTTGAAWVAGFTWDRAAAATAEIYRSALAR